MGRHFVNFMNRWTAFFVGTAQARRQREAHPADRRFYLILKAVGIGVIVLLFALLSLVFLSAQPALHHFGLGFFSESEWDPYRERFGALSFIYGTVVSSFIALLLSLPVSIAVALFLKELAPPWVRRILGFFVEMLAAIPSVVFGLWGVFVLAPWLRTTVQPFIGQKFGFIPLFSGPPYGVGMLAAGIILAIMITPTIAAICREVFETLPRSLKEAALSLGATKWEMLSLAILKNSVVGIIAAATLGLGRALGETMAVTMVIGNRAEIKASLFAPAQTMASVIANEYAEASNDLHLSALAAVGLALFLVSFLVNSIARLIIWRLQRRT